VSRDENGQMDVRC